MQMRRETQATVHLWGKFRTSTLFYYRRDRGKAYSIHREPRNRASRNAGRLERAATTPNPLRLRNTTRSSLLLAVGRVLLVMASVRHVQEESYVEPVEKPQEATAASSSTLKIRQKLSHVQDSRRCSSGTKPKWSRADRVGELETRRAKVGFTLSCSTRWALCFHRVERGQRPLHRARQRRT